MSSLHKPLDTEHSLSTEADLSSVSSFCHHLPRLVGFCLDHAPTISPHSHSVCLHFHCRPASPHRRPPATSTGQTHHIREACRAPAPLPASHWTLASRAKVDKWYLLCLTTHSTSMPPQSLPGSLLQTLKSQSSPSGPQKFSEENTTFLPPRQGPCLAQPSIPREGIIPEEWLDKISPAHPPPVLPCQFHSAVYTGSTAHSPRDTEKGVSGNCSENRGSGSTIPILGACSGLSPVLAFHSQLLTSRTFHMHLGHYCHHN